MLKLEKMELIGFKSFSGRTEVLFPDGITAVVGPNGCGKSNIGDAISWVLGEQSAKSLRGDKMEDVIFNGSEHLRPMGMAEVSIRLIHDNGASADDQKEIILTRRLFRSGESEYILNGEKCRLKDISDLLSQSYIGARTCAVIEQGRVEEIMNARPVERRLIIEEAAGIIGYKGKRKIAEAKLEATKANLLRVQDIVNEVERQMSSLKRQASRARRFSRIKDAIREKQTVLFSRKNRSLLMRLSEIETFLLDLKGQEAEILTQMGVLEATLERGKQELAQAEEDSARAIEQAHGLDRKIHEEESSAKNAAEKVTEMESSIARMLENRSIFQVKISEMENSLSEKKAEKLHVEIEKEQFQSQIKEQENALNELKEKEAQINKELEEERERLFKEAGILSELRNSSKIHDMEKKKLQSSLEKKRREEEEAKKNLHEIKGSLSQLKENTGKAEQELSMLQSQHIALSKEKDLLCKALADKEQNISNLRVLLNSLYEKENIYRSSEASYGMVDAGTKAIMNGEIAFDRAHSGVVADWIKTEEKYEKAVEGYLMNMLAALCLSSVDDAVHGLRILKEAKAGSGKFLFAPAEVQEKQLPEIPQPIRDHESFMGRLSEKVDVKNGIERNLKRSLDQCILARNIDAALMFYQWCPRLNYVTPDGEVIRSREGLAILNSAENGSKSILVVRRELESLGEETGKANAELTNREREVQELKNDFSNKTKEEQKIQENISRLEKDILSLCHEEKRLSEMLAYGEKKCQILQEELSMMEEEKENSANHFEEAVSAVASREEEFSNKEGKVKHLKQEDEHLKEQIALKSKSISTLYSEYAVSNSRAASLETDLHHLKAGLEEMKKRIDDSLMEEISGKEKIKTLKLSENISRKAFEEMMVERNQAQQSSEKLKDEIALRKESLGFQEHEIKQIRLKLDEIRTALKEEELKQAEIRGDIKHNSEACLEELARNVDEVDTQEESHEETDEGVLAQEISELKEKIQSIGPINMMAIEEYNSLEERFQFLSNQKKDLTDSIESLTETIRKINRTSRERFQKAFQEISEGFNETFKILFNGGHADLRLEDETDILESGVEIIAQPAGKKLQNINLLSGGEKALTVIALLFAVFRYRPSPFCLLDEVDSALDDANIEKFINMLRGFSGKTQFILITHNKNTMEVANLLYGVTMEEPGVSKIVSFKLN